MKLVSWNVNGLRAVMQKDFVKYFTEENADFFCIQETKMQKEQATFSMDGYYEFWNSADRKGYSGTLIYTKIKPIDVAYGINGKYNDEGRIITLEYPNYYVVTIYTPNSQDGLKRLDYRLVFEDDLREYLIKLKENKNVIICGDLNCAHQEIDLKNPKSNVMNPGFTIEERTKMSDLLNSGFVDTFRYKYPEKVEYSWWSSRFNARLKNIGWRIDYFIVNDELKGKIIDSEIRTNVFGSDHCPVVLLLEDL